MTGLLPLHSNKLLTRLLAIFLAVAALGLYAPPNQTALIPTVNQAVATYIQVQTNAAHSLT